MINVLSRLRINKLKFKKQLIDKEKNMIVDFKQNYFSSTTKGIHGTGHVNIKFLMCMAYYDSYYENIN